MQLLIGIALVGAIFSALYPDRFATWRNVENMARQGGTLAVVAIGQSFALISGGFDISVAATMGLASTIGAMAMIDDGIFAAVGAGLGAALVVGLLNGTLIARFGVTPFIATLGMLAIARGVANELSDGWSVSGIPSEFDWFGGGNWGPIPATVGMALVILILAGLYLYRTRGRVFICSVWLGAIDCSQSTNTATQSQLEDRCPPKSSQMPILRSRCYVARLSPLSIPPRCTPRSTAGNTDTSSRTSQ